MRVRFTILGPVRVCRGTTDLDLGGRQQRIVLAMLLARAGSVVSVTELVDALWPDDPPASAVNVVHRYIGALRRLIEPELPVRSTGRYLIRHAAGYQLRVDEESLDLLRFRALVLRARQAKDPVPLYLDALSLWQGRCGAGLELTHPVFVALEAEKDAAVRDAADTALRSGQARMVLPVLRQAAAEHPLDEALQARLLRALASDGHQAEAVELFRSVGVRLRDELGIGPGRELREAYDRLLHAAPQTPRPVHRPSIIGRDGELAALRRLLLGAEAGHGSMVVVHGSAGVGKSALLRAAGAEAAERGFTVLTASGVETERWFPFAALHLLLQPLSPYGEKVPDAHRQALDDAFGRGTGQPDAHRVAFAVLELLADAADRTPVLLLCDDLQWFDTPSREVLGFVARRARDHAMLVVGAVRGDTPLLDQPDLRLPPLDITSAARLLDSGAPDLPPRLRAMILDRSEGNPLALVELPKAATTGDSDELPLTQRLETAFAARTDGLSAACRTFLLVTAAEPTAPLDRRLQVASEVAGSPVTAAVLPEALAAGILTVAGGRPEFGHPLMRSAIYNRASLADRLSVHHALADALDDAGRRLAHLASAALGPDENLAAQLEEFAGQAQAAAAVPALSRAASLVLDPRRRTRLLVRAAELAGDLNDRHLTRTLLDRADLSEVGPVERARLLLVSDNAAFDPSEPSRRIHDMVRTAAGSFDVGARDVAENLLWRAAARCFFQDVDAGTRAATGAELDRWATDPDSPHALTIRAYTEPYRHGAEMLARFGRVFPGLSDGRVLHFLGSGAMVVGDFTRAGEWLSRAAAAWREQGRLGLLARALAGSWPRVYLGQLDQARAESEEGRRLAQESGEALALLGLTATCGLVAVLRGEFPAATAAVGELRDADLFPHMPFATVIAQQVDGLLALFEDRPIDAYGILARAFDPADPHHHSVSGWLLAPDLADAAVAAGRVPQARKLLADLPGLARQLPSEMMRMAAAYTAAVLDDCPFEEALAAIPAGCRLIRARLRLQHARRLRGSDTARTLLREARDEFDRLGARPWAAQARAELRAAGEHSARPRPILSEQLTAQELQIAQLAARGRTDHEIAQSLFISHRTVGTLLSRVHARLGPDLFPRP